MARRHTLPALAALLGATALATPATSQQGFVLDEIVFSATRVPTALDRVGSAVTVIGRDEIERTGARQLSDVLGRQPGVSVLQSGPLGSTTDLRIRGATPRYTATFVDGIRVDDPTGIAVDFNFGSFLTDDVGRVEILRGTQSALWGGSAVAGVVNVTTLQPDADGITQRVAVEGGSFGTLAARYGFTQRADATELAFTLSAVRSDGFSAADQNEGNTERDGFRSTRASINLRQSLNNGVTLGFAGFVQRSFNEFDAGGGPGADADNRQRRREAGARVFAEFEFGESTQEVGVSAYRISRRFSGGNPGTFSGQRLRIDWLGSTSLNPALALVYGVDISEERAQTPEQDRQSQTVGGAFAQALWAPRDDLDVSLSVRADRNSDFGSFTSGRLSSAWRAHNAVTLRGAFARGFLAPSVYQQFGDTRFDIAPNPDVGPETSRSAELGIDFALTEDARLSATVFRLDIDNAINFVFGAPSIYRNVAGRSRREGLELEVFVPVGGRVDVSANYTYTDARQPNGQRFGRVPRHELGLSVDAQINDSLRNTTTLRVQADRPDDGFPSRPMPSFAVVNTAFGWAVTDQTELTLRIDNILDRQYQLAAGFGTSDRAFYVGLASRF